MELPFAPFLDRALMPTGDFVSDPFAAAAMRTRRSVQPMGGRQEGPASFVLSNYLPHVLSSLMGLPGRAVGAAGELQRTGDVYDPAPAVETALTMVGMPGVPRGAAGSSMTNLFHGSPRTNLHFINPSRRGPFGEGIYSSPMPGVSERYAGPGGQVYQLQGEFDVYQGLGARSNAEYAGWKADKERLIAAAEPKMREAVSTIIERSRPGSGYETIGDLQRLYGSKEATQDLFKRAGFEGVSGHVDGPEVMIFGPRSLPADPKDFTLGSGGNTVKGSTAGALLGQQLPIAGLPQPQGIRAYHSSPYDFERFDTSKIGTGQGAQSYGHGIYVAENPKVSGLGGEYWNEFAERFINQRTPEGLATLFLRSTGGDRAAAIAKLRDPEFQRIAKEWGVHPQRTGEGFQNVNPEDAIRLLESNKPVGPRTYEVNINARPEQFLDWDKPLAGQSQAVQDFWKSQGIKRYPDPGIDPGSGQHIWRNTVLSAFEPGAQQLNTAGASAALREAGIPGIKYLDQGSRRMADDAIRAELAASRADLEYLHKMKEGGSNQAAELEDRITRLTSQLGTPQTSNYVLFRDDIIDILRKYGLAGGAALPPAIAGFNQPEAVQ